MMTSCLLIVMWQVKKKKENFNLNIQTQKKIEEKKFEKKISKKNLSPTFQIFSSKFLSPETKYHKMQVVLYRMSKKCN